MIRASDMVQGAMQWVGLLMEFCLQLVHITAWPLVCAGTAWTVGQVICHIVDRRASLEAARLEHGRRE